MDEQPDPGPLRFTGHARDRMAERGIAVDDVTTALCHPTRAPRPGKPGTVWIEGHARGRLLRVCVPHTDRGFVITTAWAD